MEGYLAIDNQSNFEVNYMNSHFQMLNEIEGRNVTRSVKLGHFELLGFSHECLL